MNEIIEINGVKLDVDLRTATRVEEMRVGTKVRVLNKEYNGHKVRDAVVIGFEPFKGLPTIIIAALELGYNTADIKIIYYNAETKDTEVIVALDDDIDGVRDKALASFGVAIASKQKELDALIGHRQFFLDNFKQTWGAVDKAAVK